MKANRPLLSLPDPLRGAETGTFTHHSIVDRLPEIGRRTIAENEFPAEVREKLRQLVAEIPEAEIQPLSNPLAPDTLDWLVYVEPYRHLNWLQVPWFFAETYFYRRIMQEIGYFHSGEMQGVDPFVKQKQLGLESNQQEIRALGERVSDLASSRKVGPGQLAHLLKADLWGNQADLSLWPAGSESDPAHQDMEQQQEHLLVDDSDAGCRYLLDRQQSGSRIDIIADNAGFELVVDLFLAYFMLEVGLAKSVNLHLKAHPTFVSDAIIGDVQETIDFLAEDGGEAAASIAESLKRYLDADRLKLQAHFFWTSPLPMWELPDPLREELAKSELIISKGDANYRRLLGDRHWPYTTPFDEIVAYSPAPLLALRALKSEVACGLDQDLIDETARKDPEWLVNGRWGVIQFVRSGD